MTKHLYIFPGVSNYRMHGNKLRVFLTNDVTKIGPVIKEFPILGVTESGNDQYIDTGVIKFLREEIPLPFRYAVFSDDRFPIWIMDFEEVKMPGYDIVLLDEKDRLHIYDM